jgi:class 3 adenylate cyclase
MKNRQQLTVEECLRPHFKGTLFLSYTKYIKKNYPNISIDQLFDGIPISEKHLTDSSTWVSIKFERRFMENITRALGKNISYDVGKYGASEEVLGKAFYILSKLLSVHDLISNLMKLTGLFNKVISVSKTNQNLITLDIRIKPLKEDLSAEEIDLLNQSMPDMLQNISGYYEAIAHIKGYLKAQIQYDNSNFEVRDEYQLQAKLGVIQFSNDTIPAVPIIVYVLINTLVANLFVSGLIYSLLILPLAYFIFKYKEEKKKSSYFAIEGENSLSKIESKNHMLQVSNLNIEKKLVEFEAVNDLLTKSMDNLNLQSTLQTATDNIVSKLGYTRAFIMLKAAIEPYLDFQCQTGVASELQTNFKKFRLPISENINFSEHQFSYLFNHQKSLLIKDVDSHLKTLTDPASQILLKTSGSKSFACVPVGVGTNKYGLLIADKNHSEDNLQDNDLKVLENIANQIGLSIQRSELKEREQKLMDSYSKFVPFSSIKLLGHKSVTDLKLGDHSEENLTVLFCDIRNFTKMCEQMNPKDILLFLNSYLEHVSPPIFSNNGFIDKFIGDCIMAIFTSPKDAINAAIEMQKALWTYNVSNRLGFRNTIEVAIGIHTGKSIFGPVGYGNKMELTVLSDNVNTASRIANLNKDFNTSILVSGDSFKDWKGNAETRYLGPIKIRGRNLPVKIYEIIPSVSDIAIHENELNIDFISHYINKVKKDLSARLEHKDELKNALILKDIENYSEAIKYLNILKDKFQDPIIDYHLNNIDLPENYKKVG